MGNEHSKHHHHEHEEKHNEHVEVHQEHVNEEEHVDIHEEHVNEEKHIDIPSPKTEELQHSIRKYSPKYVSTSIVLEDVILNCKPYAGKDSSSHKFEKTHCPRSYLSVGILRENYMWLYNKVCELSNEEISLGYSLLSGGYLWLPVELPPNEIIYEDAICYIYSKNQDDTIAIANLKEVLSCLKSNVLGHAQLTIRIFKDDDNHAILILLLTAFQLVDVT